jgi:cardiolipin synthase
MKGWRDTQLRVTGPVVEQIERALDQNFQEVLSPKPKKGVSLVKIGFLDEDFSYIQNDPGFLRHPIYYALLNTIRHARKTIYISAAFFIPPRRLRRLLIEAATHGADVILLVTEHSDFWIADWAFLSYAVRLLKGGVRIFLYLPTVLHTKTTVIDGAWGTVGSCNMDPLSFFHNREANLIVKDRDALARMEKDFLADLEQSRELTLQSFKMIPLWKRIAMHAARLMRPVL